jgi:hypothetical protein
VQVPVSVRQATGLQLTLQQAAVWKTMAQQQMAQ